ncbi:MAG: prepilin peptidase [Bacilli bacterium]|jgi:leader peptidase (prepilin peptidase)/N-methyltransferase
MLDIYIILFFILGSIMGSFYNVVGDRLPLEKSIIKPPSHCPNCQKKLTFIELIPIISYLLQLGKCRKCKTKLSISYLLSEVGTGLIFVLCYLTFNLSNELLIALVFSSVLIIVIISDLKYLIIPDELLLFGGICLFIIRLIMGSSFLTLLINVFIPFLVLLLIKIFGDFLFQKESLGGGDIKLMPLFGLVLGWELTLVSIFFSAFLALPISLVILHLKRTNIIPFGPFLSLSAYIIYLSKLDISWIINLIV